MVRKWWHMVIVRRVTGKSMAPKLRPGRIVLATALFRHLHPGQVVIVQHKDKELIRRIERVEDNKLYLVGDNLAASTDSRHLGWLDVGVVLGRVFAPDLSK